MPKFYIDAGHGGNDSGAVGHDLLEKELNLKIALKIQELLKNYSNVHVRMSRTKDSALSLSERTNEANTWGADALISIHCNAHPNATAKGFESFIYNGTVGPDTISFQNLLHTEIIRQIGSNVSDRGKKRANFHMCRESKMKAVLTENLFVSNAQDAKLLKSDSFLDKVAQGHVNGLEKFFGLEKIERSPSEDTGELFQVIAGTFSSYDNAQRQVKKLEADGYKAYINKK